MTILFAKNSLSYTHLPTHIILTPTCVPIRRCTHTRTHNAHTCTNPVHACIHTPMHTHLHAPVVFSPFFSLPLSSPLLLSTPFFFSLSLSLSLWLSLHPPPSPHPSTLFLFAFSLSLTRKHTHTHSLSFSPTRTHIYSLFFSLPPPRKGVMLNGPFFTTQRTTLIEYLIIVRERWEKL